MKKLTLLILLILVASVLVAAIPTKVVRLTVINKSASDVYIKLEGSDVTGAFYYLTIPAGSQDQPVIRVFTVMVDLYTRTTWQCGGFESHGMFFVDSNIRLTFTPCNLNWNCREVVGVPFFWGCLHSAGTEWHVKIHGAAVGEPKMEKVTAFKFLYARPFWFNGSWASAYLYNGYWNYHCYLWYWRIRTWSTPVGCAWRYQY